MTTRKRIAWGLRGAALAALLAYVSGLHASRSGGLVEVERWLNRPVLLIGAAAALFAVSLVVELRFRAARSQTGCAAALVVLVLGGLPIAVLSYVFGGDGRWVERKVGPEHPDRVLTITDVAFSIDPVYRVELLSGTGWSARHWDLGTWETGRGDFTRADWTGPDQITVTGDRELRVFDVLPDGSLGEPRITPAGPTPAPLAPPVPDQAPTPDQVPGQSADVPG